MEMPSLAGGLNIPEYPGDYFHYVFVKILMAGRANGLQVIDGPYVKVRDPEGFREFCKRAQILGYDGKWALHPDQVTILNEVFGTSQEQFDRAVDILEAYEKATTEGDRKGAVMFGDEMIDEASPQGRGEGRVPRRARRDEALVELTLAASCSSAAELRDDVAAGRITLTFRLWTPAAGEGRRSLRDRRRSSSRSTTWSSSPFSSVTADETCKRCGETDPRVTP